MSRPLDVPLPDPLARGLSRLASHLRSLLVVRGVGVAFVVVAMSLGAGLLFDLAFNLSPRARLALLVAHSIIAAGAIAWLVLRPLFRRLRSEDLAAVVESAFPQLGERLISTIELSDPATPDAHKGSTLMREELLRQTVESSQSLDFASSVAPVRSLRLFAFGAAGVLLLVVPFVFSPGVYGLLWSRLLTPWGNFDSAGNLLFVVEDGDRVVARGDDVTIRARPRWRRVAGELTEPVWLVRSGAGPEQDARRMEWDEASGTFTTTVAHVLSSFDFNVSSGRARSRGYHVEVLDAPEIAALTLQVEPPAYTGRVAERHDGALGEIPVFEGSQLKFRAGFNKPVADARLEWLDGHDLADAKGARPTMPLALAEDGLSATLDVEATRGGPFALHLTDEHDLHNRRHPPRAIRLVRDEPPRLQLGGSDEPAQARPGDKVQVAAEAFDDVAVEGLELHAQILGGDNTIIAADASKLGASRVQHDFLLDLDAFKLKQGAVLTYRIRAVDGRPVPGPQEVWSNRRVITVDSSAAGQGAQELAKRHADLKKRLEEIRAQLVANREQTAQLHKSATTAAEKKAEFADDDKLRQVPAGQLEMARQLETLADDFRAQPLFEKLADRTTDVARNEIVESSVNLTKAVDGSLPEKTSALNDSVNKLIVADEKLTDIAKQFDTLAGIEHDLLELNKLAREAQKLADEAQALHAQRDAAASGGQADQTAQQKQARNEQLASDQEQLRKRQEKLNDELKAMLQRQPELVNAARQQQLDRLAELSKQAADLAEPQEMLAEGLRDEPPKPEKESIDDEKQKTESKEARQPAPPTRSDPQARPDAAERMQSSQQQAALSAAQLAIETARQTGAKSGSTGKALESARQATEAARSLLAGQLDRAAQSAQKAAESANQAAAEMSGDSPSESTSEPLSRQARQLASQQDQIAKELAGLSQSADERSRARVAGERQIAAETRQVTQRLDDVASRLSVEPLTLIESASLADGAASATRQADQSMQQAGASMQKRDLVPAADSAQQAGQELRQAAERAAAGAPSDRKGRSPVPAEIADRVTDAARRLEQARQQLSANESDGKAANKTPGSQTGEKSNQGQQPSQQAGSGSQQGQAKALAESSQSMQRAAEALAQAAKQLEPGRKSNADANSPSQNTEGGSAGGGAKKTVDLSELQADVQQFAKRDWGQLPGQLQTEILQAAGRTPNSNYAKLIRLYFREIAENKSTEPTVASPRDRRDEPGGSKSSSSQK